MSIYRDLQKLRHTTDYVCINKNLTLIKYWFNFDTYVLQTQNKRNMKKALIALIAICMFGFGTAIQAQNAIPASGGNATGSGGSVSYTVGQVVYITNTGTNGTLAQGVQQPYEISVVTVIKEYNDILLECLVYPNPSTDFVILKTRNYEVENLSYQLWDINGKLIYDKKADGVETYIPMGNLMSATYFLKVIYRQKEVKTFKIIKN